jgi:hypothetical protein
MTKSLLSIKSQILSICLGLAMFSCSPSNIAKQTGAASLSAGQGPQGLSQQTLSELCIAVKASLGGSTPPCPDFGKFKALWVSIGKHETWQSFATANNIQNPGIPIAVLNNVYAIARRQVRAGFVNVVEVAEADGRDIIALVKDAGTNGDGLALTSGQTSQGHDSFVVQPGNEVAINPGGLAFVLLIGWVAINNWPQKIAQLPCVGKYPDGSGNKFSRSPGRGGCRLIISNPRDEVLEDRIEPRQCPHC